MSRCLMMLFRNILQSRGPPLKVDSKRSKTWEIPSDIVEVIFKSLSDVDQACFALSCRRLYAYYVLYAGQRGTCPLSTLPRTELLPRLQDERWVYCGGCQNLHRYSRWWPLCVHEPPFFDFRNLIQAREPLSRDEFKQGESDRTKKLLPSRIVEIIFQFLSAVDQACFALSCKRLHAHYVLYTRQRGINPLLVLPRTQFLHRLQNERWVYCSQCRDLHRYSRWRPLLFTKKCEQKPSVSKCKAWCYENAGKVDICPCSSITFHQKQHPDDYFQSRRGAYWTHSCTFQHPLARVVIRSQVQFCVCTKTFRVENQFTFQITQEKASLELFRKISSRLSTYETEDWLRSFLSAANAGVFIGDESSNRYQCYGWNHSGARPYSFVILLYRDLGGTGWPCRKWKHNCHE